jgi:hypothetical protein
MPRMPPFPLPQLTASFEAPIGELKISQPIPALYSALVLSVYKKRVMIL